MQEESLSPPTHSIPLLPPSTPPPVLSPSRVLTPVAKLLSKEVYQDVDDKEDDVTRLGPNNSNTPTSTLTISHDGNRDDDADGIGASRKSSSPTPRLLSAVMIPNRKRPSSDRPSSGMSPTENSYVQPFLTSENSAGSVSTKTTITPEQRAILEKAFLINQYPKRETQQQLAEDIGAPVTKINKWFEYRRRKDRLKDSTHSTPTTSPATSPPPESAENIELLQPTPPVQLVQQESDGEDTTSADGVLGSSSVRYRTVSGPSRSFTARSAQPISNKSGASGGKLASAEIVKTMAGFLRGGSIYKSTDVQRVVDLMQTADNNEGRKYILNALLSTKSLPILQVFRDSQGPTILRDWIADARRDISSHQCEEVLLKILATLRTLPFDLERLKETKLGKLIKQLATDKAGSEEVTAKAMELKDLWVRLIPGTEMAASRSDDDHRLENARKKPRLDPSASFAKPQQELFQLPKFAKARPGGSKDVDPKPMSRRMSDPDFFKRLSSHQPSSSSAITATSAATTAFPTTVPTPAIAPAALMRTNQHASSSHASSRRSTTTIPAVTVLTSSATSTQNPGPLPRKVDFDPHSARHDKAREAAMKLAESMNNKKKRKVQFKEGDELVSIRIIESREDLESMDEDETGAEMHDGYMDGRNEYEDEGDGDSDVHHPRYGSPPPPSPTQPSGSLESSALHNGPFKPAFMIPAEDQQDLVNGIFWRWPLCLRIEFEPNEYGELPVRAHGDQSAEYAIQERREMETRSVEYASVADIPPSPTEPDNEPHLEVEPPKVVPLFQDAADHGQALLHTLTLIYQKITITNFGNHAL
ncbi:hypothetical protein BGZ99_002915 [Dissophora globulifera]|uniref:Homeobox domain-containing protein n=1 Tax=Dissophora globulifera TaxID=979702 RepID=A0A9P6RQU5_9FUNG|nr:hypothetical protein BGZ99_002915 [Dissophora globulifera]